MDEANPVENPSLSQEVMESAKLDQSMPYRELRGSLMYAANITRVDIAFATGKVSRKSADPTEADWAYAKRFLRYLRCKESMCIRYSGTQKSQLKVYCDADFAGDDKSPYSTTGFVVLYNDAPIHWKSKRQSSVARSSTEAELISLTHAIDDTLWIKELATELDIVDERPVPVYCDNQSTIRIVTDEKSMHRTRHLKAKAGYVREKIEEGTVEVSHVTSDNQLADMLTKSTTGPKFVKNRNMLMSALFYILMVLGMMMRSEELVFEKVASIIWTKTSHWVNHGQNQYLLELRFTTPCPLLKNLTAPERRKRQAGGHQTVNIGMQASNQQPVPGSGQTNGIVSIPSYQGYGDLPVAEHEDMPVPPTKRGEQTSDFENARREAVSFCNQVYDEYIITQISNINKNKVKDPKELVKHKRSLLETVTSALFYSNIVTTFLNKIFLSNNEKELAGRQHLVEEKVEKMNKEMNYTVLLEKAIGSSLESMAEIVKHPDRRLSTFVHSFPNVVVLTNYLTMDIFRKSTLMSHIIHSIKFKKFDLVSLSELLDTDMYENIVESSVKVTRLYSPSRGVIRIEFRGRVRDPTTDVVRVDAFRYWANLTGLPTLMEYSGEKFLIHNRSSECIRAIDEPPHEYVTAICDHHSNKDRRLAIWSKVLQTIDPYTQPSNTTIKESWPYVYIYCYRLNITMRRETARCPPSVFKMNATIPWNTTDLTFDPQTYEMHRDVDAAPATHEVHMVHFHQEEHLIDRNLAIDEVIRLNKEKEKLIQEAVAINLPIQGAKLSYSSALYPMLSMTALGFLFLFITQVYRTFDRKQRHHQVMRTVTEGIYGDGTYEVFRRSNRVRNTAQLTAPAQINVTLNGTGLSTAPPPLPPHRRSVDEQRA